MSASVVSIRHIDHLVAALLEHSIVSRAGADETGQTLLRACVDSVVHRYSLAGTAEEADYRVRVACYAYRPAPVLSSAEVAELAECLDYQSCERDDWCASKAFMLLERLRGALLRARTRAMEADLGLD